MKTYTKQITETKPVLEIRQDGDSESPREWSNLGYFITCDRNYHSPDKNEVLVRIVKDTGDSATSQEEHIKLIKEEFESETNAKVLAIYPISKYEHDGVSYSLGTKHGFDNSNNAFYIITDKTQKEIGATKSNFEKIIEAELENYNKYINGEVYSFVLFDKDGEVIDRCGGFYDIEDIRENLGKEWSKETLSDYIKQ